MDIQALVTQLAALGGVAALIAFLVNALKKFGVVKDGDAKAWVAGFNLAALVGLFLLNTFAPSTDIVKVDSLAGLLSQLGVYVLAFVVQLGVTGKTNDMVVGTPVIGFSYSQNKED